MREATKVYLPGHSTGSPTNVSYRMAKLRQHVRVNGTWLDYGCADGAYSDALLKTGAGKVFGVDLEADRIAAARARNIPGAAFECLDLKTFTIPAEDRTFDGVFMNEVLEHVQDEDRTLREVLRVMKPGATLALMSPNRWFPFDGHGIDIGRGEAKRPVFLVPWIPSFLTRRVLVARNYWPGELRGVVAASGFSIRRTDSVFPVLEQCPWLPSKNLVRLYQKYIMSIEKLPLLRRFGVSTLVVAERP